MKDVKRVITWLDNFQRRHPVVGFPFAVIKKYSDDEAAHNAALLAYYGFLSLFPLLLVLATIMKLILRGEGDLQQRILEGATNYFPIIGQDLQQNVHTLGSTGLALFVGIALTLFGARGVADIFRISVNHVWQVPRLKRAGFPGSIAKSFRIIAIGGFGFLAAPLLSAYAVSFGHGIVFRLIALLLTAGILFGVFLFLTHTAISVRRPLKQFWVGAAVATVGLLILQSLGGYLLANHLKSLNDLYGTFAIVLGLLYWIFLQAQVVMYALEIDSVRVLGLWPRALNQGVLTAEDRKAFRLYAHRNTFHDDEEVDVTTRKPLRERLRKRSNERPY